MEILQVIKRILIGYPKKDLKEACKLFGKVKEDALPSEEVKKVVNRVLINMIWKCLCFPAGVWVGFSVNPIPGAGFPLLVHSVLSIYTYRLLTVENNYRTHKFIKSFVDK